MKTVFFACLVMCLLVVPAFAQPQYEVGDQVNDFTLLDSGGNPVSLSNYPGRIIFMIFWQSG
jgi:hypothetical protein